MLRAAEQIARYGWLTNRPVTAATNYTELAALNDLRTSGPTTEQDDYMHASRGTGAQRHPAGSTGAPGTPASRPDCRDGHRRSRRHRRRDRARSLAAVAGACRCRAGGRLGRPDGKGTYRPKADIAVALKAKADITCADLVSEL